MARTALARLGEPEDAPLTLEAFLRANAVPAGVDLGSCVLVSRSGGGRSLPAFGSATADHDRMRSIEGVVIEVVAPGRAVRSVGVVYSRLSGSSRSTVTRYVVQCADRRVVRRLPELVVVCR